MEANYLEPSAHAEFNSHPRICHLGLTDREFAIPVQESAEICVGLAKKHKENKFICASNFPHPQFKGLWEDIELECDKKITAIIKS